MVVSGHSHRAGYPLAFDLLVAEVTAMSETRASYIACCNQCGLYTTVPGPATGLFLVAYCLASGRTLSIEPVAVSIPADCPRGLGYKTDADSVAP